MMFRSTKGASKVRRDQINNEILVVRDLLPLPESARQRLSQLQIMSLACIFIRKSNYFARLFGNPGYSVEGPFEFAQTLPGFLLVATRDGKMLYLSENVTEYLGHSMVDMMTQGDSIYDIIDKRDHTTVQSQLLQTSFGESQNQNVRSFFCRMNIARTLRRQSSIGDQKIMHVHGQFIQPMIRDHYGNQPVFLALCSPLITPETKETALQNNTMVFKSIHSLDMKYMEISQRGEHHLGVTTEDVTGRSWYSLLHPEDAQEARDKHVQLIHSSHEMGCMLTVRLIRNDNTCIWVNTVMHIRQPYISDNGEAAIMCINQVISENEAPYFKMQSQIYTAQMARNSEFMYSQPTSYSPQRCLSQSIPPEGVPYALTTTPVATMDPYSSGFSTSPNQTNYGGQFSLRTAPQHYLGDSTSGSYTHPDIALPPRGSLGSFSESPSEYSRGSSPGLQSVFSPSAASQFSWPEQPGSSIMADPMHCTLADPMKSTLGDPLQSCVTETLQQPSGIKRKSEDPHPSCQPSKMLRVGHSHSDDSQGGMGGIGSGFGSFPTEASFLSAPFFSSPEGGNSGSTSFVYGSMQVLTQNSYPSSTTTQQALKAKLSMMCMAKSNATKPLTDFQPPTPESPKDQHPLKTTKEAVATETATVPDSYLTPDSSPLHIHGDFLLGDHKETTKFQLEEVIATITKNISQEPVADLEKFEDDEKHLLPVIDADVVDECLNSKTSSSQAVLRNQSLTSCTPSVLTSLPSQNCSTSVAKKATKTAATHGLKMTDEDKTNQFLPVINVMEIENYFNHFDDDSRDSTHSFESHASPRPSSTGMGSSPIQGHMSPDPSCAGTTETSYENLLETVGFTGDISFLIESFPVPTTTTDAMSLMDANNVLGDSLIGDCFPATTSWSPLHQQNTPPSYGVIVSNQELSQQLGDVNPPPSYGGPTMQ
ncbi:neuronal PAS domain-containing protein 4 isoform X2 [Lingula anatina]|uniref:Neuronal PAS domain-containing protein 4 isoform X2 n=1 Tax=Lingula anatina TaxID=7574 RepID=A0A1S3H882_LINAN|nr:neuronal PAS domain-containing protein 4 isoform X2 [Lingula anatina]|eukprot:XP_013382208.1 neuronal PAS domain-containing protein 4 isoform X2 [Lingula anatina]